MIIRHSELESCRTNVRAWVTARHGGGSRPGWSYAYATRCAIYRFHKLYDEAQTVDYLEDLLRRVHLTNAIRVGESRELIRGYCGRFFAQPFTVADVRIRIALDVGAGVKIGGEVSRMDVDPAGGYRAVLLGDVTARWSDQLRMPLLQRAVAIKYRHDEDLVSVGVQRLDGTGLDTRRFSRARIVRAVAEAQRVAGQVSALLWP